jgi:AraC-like DNA-binding protein
MNYRERLPHPALASVIESVWSLSDDTGSFADGSMHRVFPDGCIEMIVHLGSPFAWKPEGGPPQRQPYAFVVGQLTRPMWLIPGVRFEAVAVRFRPWAAYAALGADLGELADGVVPLEALWGHDARRMAAAMSDVRTDARRQQIIERFIAERLKSARIPHPATRWVVQEIVRQRGQVRIERLAHDVGWTARHLERRFTREVGTLPKTLVRTVRFQHLLDSLASVRGDDWAGLAWDCGFSDQAHLIREFRRFTGATPAHLREEALSLARQFISPERLHRFFAYPPHDGSA